MLLTLLLFRFTMPFAQTQVVMHKISGKVKDSVTGQAVEYATVSINNQSTKKIINGTITDAKGLFLLQNIPSGVYSITIESIGYTSNTIKNFTVKNEEGDVKLKEIIIQKKSNNLQAVTVTGTRQVIENRLDKTVYNLDKDITSQGGVATDALKKIPGVTVDIDGNVELLGNPSVRFLIDGKPSGIFGNSVADALQSIPNSQIQSIEVITSPSAKYDAAGTGGIINIILKKSKIEGFNGNINIAAGTRLENGSMNTSYKHNHIGLNAYFSGNAQLTSSTPNGLDRITATNTNRLIQESSTDVNRNGYKGGASLDWAVSKNDNITASLGFDHFGFTNNGTTNQNIIAYNSSGIELSNVFSIRNANNQSNVTDFENSLSYKRKLKKAGQEIELSYSGSFGNNSTAYNQLQYYKGSNSGFAGSNSLNPGHENEINIAIDYTQQISKDFLLETGVKTVRQAIISNADVFTLNATTGSFTKDIQQSYTSDYRRSIYAGYVTGTFSLFRYLDIKAGIRYEYTISMADYSNAHNVGIPNYSNLAPSFIIGHTFAYKQTVKFAYTYRLERPEYRDLNPFMNLADPHNITTGNPNIQPEIGKKIEFVYNKSFESGASININFNAERNSPDIKPYIVYYPTYKIGDSTYTDVTLTTRANISSEVRAGVNISGSLPITKKLTIRPNIQLFNRHLKNIYATPSVVDAFGYRVNINGTYLFTKDLAAEAFGNYNLGLRWQGKQASVYSYTLAIRKQFNNNKASLGLIAVNPFNHYINQKSQQVTQDFTSNIYRNVPYRSFGVTFSYKFGKLKFTKTKEADNFNYTPPVEN